MKISWFPTIKSKVAQKISISDWLKGQPDWIEKVRELRNAPKNQQRDLKEKLPCCIPSGIFKQPNDEGLLEFSGLMSLDFDKVPEPEILKTRLIMLPWVYYSGLSCSGEGVFALVRVGPDAPFRWKSYFSALAFRINSPFLDERSSNISRRRFFSFDPNGRFNLDPKIYHIDKENPTSILTRLYRDSVKTQKYKIRDADESKIAALTKIIESSQIDITRNYYDWISIAGALANILGENGRSYFHRLSQFYNNYDPVDTDVQYDKVMFNRPDFGLGVIFAIASRHHVFLKEPR